VKDEVNNILLALFELASENDSFDGVLIRDEVKRVISSGVLLPLVTWSTCLELEDKENILLGRQKHYYTAHKIAEYSEIHSK
jgi:hypothetical protein